jgi:hypothetical protein
MSPVLGLVQVCIASPPSEGTRKALVYLIPPQRRRQNESEAGNADKNTSAPYNLPQCVAEYLLRLLPITYL